MKQIHHITLIFSIILYTIHFLLKLKMDKFITGAPSSTLYKYKRTYRFYITVKLYLYWTNERSALQNTFYGKY